MSYFYTSESVSEGHPDKVCDQIADALLDHYIAADADSKVALEALTTRGLLMLGGEISSTAHVDYDRVARSIIREIGYTKSEYGFAADSCGILSAIHGQSPDIHRGVIRATPEEQGAGDQGIMFGYATNETPDYMPLTTDLSNELLKTLAKARKEGVLPYLRPDAKSQVTVEYDDAHHPIRIDTIVLSTQHDEFIRPKDSTKEAQQEADEEMRMRIQQDIEKYILPPAIDSYGAAFRPLSEKGYKLLVNPTGKFVIGGPYGDAGVTGRKVIVDTYGGRSGHGGGAFSGKDPSKVDRPAAYAARHIAKNLAAAGIADEISIQLAYAIGIAEPISIYVNTFGTNKTRFDDGEIAKKIGEIFDLRPYAIEQNLKLRTPIYRETAAYGHFGRTPRTLTKHFEYSDGKSVDCEVELFSWEKLDAVDLLRSHLL